MWDSFGAASGDDPTMTWTKFLQGSQDASGCWSTRNLAPSERGGYALGLVSGSCAGCRRWLSELPFTGWAKDKFNLGGSDEIEDTTDYPVYEDPGEPPPKPPADPLSDEAMSLGFFRDDALKSRGWDT